MLLDVNISPTLWLTFATPMLVRQFKDVEALNGALRRILLQRERDFPKMRTGGLNRSNLHGWRSEPDFLTWPEPEIARLKDMMKESAAQVMQLAAGQGRQAKLRVDYNLAAWANINRDRSYNVNHSHPENHWSGVYYVSTGEPEPGYPMNGLIEFQDPRGAATALPIPGFDFGHKQTIPPQPGLMLVFPSWHIHMVHPFYGQGERISIAFNLHINKFELVPVQ